MKPRNMPGMVSHAGLFVKSDTMTAWWGSGHPSALVSCPTCCARPGFPCVSRAFGVGALGAITGLHAARIDVARMAVR